MTRVAIHGLSVAQRERPDHLVVHALGDALAPRVGAELVGSVAVRHHLLAQRCIARLLGPSLSKRKEELLVDKGTLSKMWVLRRVLMPMGVTDAMEFLIDKLKSSRTNADFFEAMNS